MRHAIAALLVITLFSLLPNSAFAQEKVLAEQIKQLQKELDQTKNELKLLKEAGVRKWYKIQIYTKPSGAGGTDGDIFFSFAGSRARTYWRSCDSPGDSHEQKDWDFYYFTNDELGENISWDIYLKSDARNGIDNWSYKLWLFELNGKEWTEKLYLDRTSYARGGGTRPDHYAVNGSCHFDKNGTKSPTGTGPSGHDLCTITKGMLFQSRFDAPDAGPERVQSDESVIDKNLDDSQEKLGRAR